jgi:hypothetical protein
MPITFKEFHSKAEQVDIHSTAADKPWTSPSPAFWPMSRTLEHEPQNDSESPEQKHRTTEHAWRSLWYLALICRLAGISISKPHNRL